MLSGTNFCVRCGKKNEEDSKGIKVLEEKMNNAGNKSIFARFKYNRGNIADKKLLEKRKMTEEKEKERKLEKRMQCDEFYKYHSEYNGIGAYEGRIYYINRAVDEEFYLCTSNENGYDIRILSKIEKDYWDAEVHANATGIYLYSRGDGDHLFVLHLDFEGNKLKESREYYPGGCEAGYMSSNLCFCDNRVYFVYTHEENEVQDTQIRCMEIDQGKIYILYDKAAEIKRLFAFKEKLIFEAIYKKGDKQSNGWMVFDLLLGKVVECLSNPYCNPENIIRHPEIYDEESSQYNEQCNFDRNIVFFDFNRDIFWTQRVVEEKNDGEWPQYVTYREPRSLWGNRDKVIMELPVWKILEDHSQQEYFDGTNRYYASSYYCFESADVSGRTVEWSIGNGGHGECNKFRVIGNYLFLNVAGWYEEQYELTKEKFDPLRKSWFSDRLSQELVDEFTQEKNRNNVVLCNCNNELEVYDLYAEKEIGNTDIKYNICTFGSKFHIGFGVPVTISINGKTYDCKTHNSVKGRIDGMKKLYTDNDIIRGDILTAEFYAHDNLIILKKR